MGAAGGKTQGSYYLSSEQWTLHHDGWVDFYKGQRWSAEALFPVSGFTCAFRFERMHE